MAEMAVAPMQIKNALVTSLRVCAVCLLFDFCMAAGAALSGLNRVAQQSGPAPGDFVVPLLIFSLCVGASVSYLILRSRWHGWTLASAMFLAIYGISTVATQVETLFFLSNKLPAGMARALFLQGAISTLFFAPFAVLVLGKWREQTSVPDNRAFTRPRPASAAWRVALLVVAFVFLYMLFGYFVAWQNAELRAYYGGPSWPTFLAALKGNWANRPGVFALAACRAVLYIVCVFPLVRMLRVGRWESAAAVALFLSVWTTVLLLPNPLMPASVARSHFVETLGFSLVFGSLLGWLLNPAPPSIAKEVTAGPDGVRASPR
jgi:hypothetical protein